MVLMIVADRYSARLYRNPSADICNNLSAVFCMCLNHPVYTEVLFIVLYDDSWRDLCYHDITLQHCDDVIGKEYPNISSRRDAVSVSSGPMTLKEITIAVVCSEEWEVDFDKMPTKVNHHVHINFCIRRLLYIIDIWRKYSSSIAF